jgi:hypothetical protein
MSRVRGAATTAVTPPPSAGTASAISIAGHAAIRRVTVRPARRASRTSAVTSPLGTSKAAVWRTAVGAVSLSHPVS